jgi:hypothetical protein
LRIAQLADGFTYRSRSEARRAAQDCLAEFPADVAVCPTARHNWFGRIENEVTRDAPLTLPYHGEAFAASAAWNTVLAAELVRTRQESVLLPVWGLNGECSALLLASG